VRYQLPITAAEKAKKSARIPKDFLPRAKPGGLFWKQSKWSWSFEEFWYQFWKFQVIRSIPPLLENACKQICIWILKLFIEFHGVPPDDRFSLDVFEDLPLFYFNPQIKVGLMQCFGIVTNMISHADDEIWGRKILRQSKVAVWNSTWFGWKIAETCHTMDRYILFFILFSIPVL
jgi:hypothetical protein